MPFSWTVRHGTSKEGMVDGGDTSNGLAGNCRKCGVPRLRPDVPCGETRPNHTALIAVIVLRLGTLRYSYPSYLRTGQMFCCRDAATRFPFSEFTHVANLAMGVLLPARRSFARREYLAAMRFHEKTARWSSTSIHKFLLLRLGGAHRAFS